MAKKSSERVETGVTGLDKIINGGFIPGSAVLLTGGAGTGKTIFSGQFLFHGLKKGENGVYITFEETPDEIKEDFLEFGWDLAPFEKKGNVIIEYKDPFEIADISSVLVDEISRLKAKRVVIDSASIFGMFLKDEHDIRKRLYKLIQLIKSTGATTILTSEIPEGSDRLSRFGVEEFVVDGVIVLRYVPMGKMTQRTIEVRKMRKTNINEGTYGFEFGKNGVKIVD